MNNAADKSVTKDRHEVIFSTTYGSVPRFLWYLAIPFLLLGPGIFFYRAAWFGEGLLIKNIRVPPSVVMYAICPVCWLLCVALVAVEIYCRRNPQLIKVTTSGISLPKGRWTSGVVRIAWDHLRADLEGRRLTVWDIYELTCTDERDETSVRVNSMLFRDFDNFATLTLILGKHMGQDWTIKGFWPGTIRGTQPTHPFLDRDRG